MNTLKMNVLNETKNTIVASISRLCIVIFVCLGVVLGASAQPSKLSYMLSPGDAIRIVVFQNSDLTLDTRVPESGVVTYPLIGRMRIGGKTLEEAEYLIAEELKQGGYVKNPQVNITLMQMRGNQVSVLGKVHRPGRFPLDGLSTRLADVLAIAGGVSQNGSDTVTVKGSRSDKPFQVEIDLPAIFSDVGHEQNIVIHGGDVIYVPKAPVFYIHGEVKRPGAYRIERGMTVQQALAQGGGATARGAEKKIRLHRKINDGKTKDIKPSWFDLVKPNDVLYVRESMF